MILIGSNRAREVILLIYGDSILADKIHSVCMYVMVTRAFQVPGTK